MRSSSTDCLRAVCDCFDGHGQDRNCDRAAAPGAPERLCPSLLQRAGAVRRVVRVAGRPQHDAAAEGALAHTPIVIDELDYLTLKPEQVNAFLRLMDQRYAGVSAIITTNLTAVVRAVRQPWSMPCWTSCATIASRSASRDPRCASRRRWMPRRRAVLQRIASPLASAVAQPSEPASDLRQRRSVASTGLTPVPSSTTRRALDGVRFT
jgi:hypothetical protein